MGGAGRLIERLAGSDDALRLAGDPESNSRSSMTKPSTNPACLWGMLCVPGATFSSMKLALWLSKGGGRGITPAGRAAEA